MDNIKETINIAGNDINKTYPKCNNSFDNLTKCLNISIDHF